MAIRPIIDWLLGQALADFRLGDLVAGISTRLLEAGYALHRFHVTVRILHPIYSGTAFTWTPEQGLRRDAFARSDSASENWLRSPLHYMMKTASPNTASASTTTKAWKTTPSSGI